MRNHTSVQISDFNYLFRATVLGDEQALGQWLTPQPDAATQPDAAARPDAATQPDAAILGNMLRTSALLGHSRFTEVLLIHNRDLAIRGDSSGRTALHLASAEGNLHTVQKLLLFNNDNNPLCLVRDGEGRIPLHYAAIRGRTEVVQELILASPKSLRPSDPDKTTVFHLCVIHNHLETLEALLKLDYAAAAASDSPSHFFKRPDSDGNTILHLAIKFKRFEAVKYLLSIPEIKELEKEKNAKGLTARGILELSPVDEKINEIKLMWTKNVQNSCVTWTLKHTGNCFIKILNWIDKRLKEGDSINWFEQMRGNLSAASIFIATVTFQALIHPPGGFIQHGLSSSSSSSSQDNTSSSPLGLLNCMTLNSTNYCPGEALSPVNHGDSFEAYAVYITVSFYASLCVTLLLVSGARLQSSTIIWILSVLMAVTLFFLALAYSIAVEIVAPQNVSLTGLSHQGFILWCSLLLVVTVFYALRSLSLKIE